jgi:rubrerythrin
VRARLLQVLQTLRDRFEESEGKRIFLEFADEERAHLDLLRREYRALDARARGRSERGRRQASS